MRTEIVMEGEGEEGTFVLLKAHSYVKSSRIMRLNILRGFGSGKLGLIVLFKGKVGQMFPQKHIGIIVDRWFR